MAVRQQQRRGTAAQWTAANPILSAAEIGFEIDTNKFKIGDGINRWADLIYFTADAAAALADLIDGAPDLLNTLNELAAAIGDDANFVTTMTNSLALKAPLASPSFTGTVSGVTKSMVGLGSVDNTADSAKPVSTAQATAIATAKSEAITTAATDATSKVAAEATARANAVTAAIATAAADATSKVAAEATARNSAITTAVAGVVGAAPAALDTLKELADALTADESTASTLATLVGTKAPSANPTFTGTVSGITSAMVGLGNVDNTSDANKPVSTATQAALDAKLASATAASTYETISNVALKAPLASPTFTGTVSGITKSMVGLGSVDNTADSAKPVSTATQTALDAKAPLASPALTGTPTAPTASYSTNSTQLATTAFVQSVFNNIGSLNLVLDGGGV
jgi:hypothetical protein